MSYHIDDLFKEVEELKNLIQPEKVAFFSYVFLNTQNLLRKPGQKVTIETKNGGVRIDCSASRTVAISGMYELIKTMGLEDSLNMLAAIHALKQTNMVDMVVKGGVLPSEEAFTVMKELMDKSPEEIEKLKEQLDV